MLIEYFGIHINIMISLAVILACLAGSIVYSIRNQRKKAVPHE
jgi:amino acid permease